MTEPPPVGPWLGVAGIVVGFATVGAIGALEIVRRSFENRTWPWVVPLYLLGLAQLRFVFLLGRRLTVREIEGWPARATVGEWRPYFAAGAGLTVAALLMTDWAFALVVGLLVTLAVCALQRGERRWRHAVLLYAVCTLLAAVVGLAGLGSF